MPKAPKPAPVTADSVASFISIIHGLPDVTDGFYTYRGTRNVKWKTNPGLFRPGRKSLLENEREIIRELQAIHPQEFASDESMFDRLVRMQHFNLPTRLLDVTANPLVALFFATEEADPKLEAPTDGIVHYYEIPNIRKKYFDSDTISCVANLCNLSSVEKAEIQINRGLPRKKFNELPVIDRLVQFIRAEKPSLRAIINPDELDMRWYVVPKLSNRRIIAQNGAFLIYGLDTGRLKVPAGSSLKIYKIIIEKASKAKIRRELNILGINQASLFPEIDRAAEYIVARYS